VKSGLAWNGLGTFAGCSGNQVAVWFGDFGGDSRVRGVRRGTGVGSPAWSSNLALRTVAKR